MRITQPVCVNQNKFCSVNDNNRYTRSCCRVQKDVFTPSFTGLKKSQFQGIDFAVVEKFKAPIEKFHSMDDFLAWVKDEYVKICCKDYGGRNYETMMKRESMVSGWELELQVDKHYTDPERLIIMDGITKGMKPNDETICPVFNKDILNNTLNELKEKLAQDKKSLFDFGKMYKTNLRKMYLKKSSASNDEAKWIIIPTKINDPEHFNENIEKLQTLSCHEWCTKHGGAGFYLTDGDFHIFMDHGKPKLAIRMDEDIVKEVNGELNDYMIPKEYVGILDKYMKDNDFLTTPKVDSVIENAKRLAGYEQKADEAVLVKANETKESKQPKSLFERLLGIFK